MTRRLLRCTALVRLRCELVGKHWFAGGSRNGHYRHGRCTAETLAERRRLMVFIHETNRLCLLIEENWPSVLRCGNFAFWHLATDHILIGDGRFWGEADMHDHAARTAVVVNDPN